MQDVSISAGSAVPRGSRCWSKRLPPGLVRTVRDQQTFSFHRPSEPGRRNLQTEYTKGPHASILNVQGFGLSEKNHRSKLMDD